VVQRTETRDGRVVYPIRGRYKHIHVGSSSAIHGLTRPGPDTPRFHHSHFERVHYSSSSIDIQISNESITTTSASRILLGVSGLYEAGRRAQAPMDGFTACPETPSNILDAGIYGDPTRIKKGRHNRGATPFLHTPLRQRQSDVLHLIDLVLDITSRRLDDNNIALFLADQSASNG
jgi:hypothetical protein